MLNNPLRRVLTVVDHSILVKVRPRRTNGDLQEVKTEVLVADPELAVRTDVILHLLLDFLLHPVPVRIPENK